MTGAHEDYRYLLTVTKFNSAGVQQWDQFYSGPSYNRGQSGRAVTVDKVNNLILVAGEVNSNAFLLTLSRADGAVQSSRQLHGLIAGSVATDGATVYVAGLGYYTNLCLWKADAAKACLQWVLGASGESCTATCREQSRVCNETHFGSATTQETFSSVIASTVDTFSGQPLGSAESFCSGGWNTLTGVGSPVAQTLQLALSGGSTAVRTTCNYPTNWVSSACDAVVTAAPARRFCPCTAHTCEPPPPPPVVDYEWFLGRSGESCDATCNAAPGGKHCTAAPLIKIQSSTDFYAMVAASANVDGTILTTDLPTSYCSAGLNLYDFASAPAALTYVVPNAGTRTACTYPTLSHPLNTACGVSFAMARRFCSCTSYNPATPPTPQPVYPSFPSVRPC